MMCLLPLGFLTLFFSASSTTDYANMLSVLSCIFSCKKIQKICQNRVFKPKINAARGIALFSLFLISGYFIHRCTTQISDKFDKSTLLYRGNVEQQILIMLYMYCTYRTQAKYVQVTLLTLKHSTTPYIGTSIS